MATFEIKTGKRVFHGCKRERLVFSEVRAERRRKPKANKNRQHGQTAKEKKKMKAEMTIKAGTFTNKEGKKIDFVSYTAEIMGEEIRFEPRETDKKLLNFLLRGCELEDEANEDEDGEEIDAEEVARLKRV